MDTKPPARALRKREAMAEFVRLALEENCLLTAYEARPPYQRNDYLLWINKAKLEATKQKRLEQMLDELRHGDVYMNMDWSGR